MKEIVGLAGSLLWILTAQLTWAGPLVFGPQKFAIQSGKHLKEVVAFEVANPNGKHWLRVDNGEAVPIVGGEPGAIEIINLVDGGRILLNGKAVARSPDFHHRQTKAFGFTKDVTLQAVNTLEVDLRGEIGSFITLQIRKAEPNVTVSNSKGDLDGLNMGDQITLWWSRDEGAAEYVFSRSTSVKGPWQEIFRQDVITAGASGAAVDATPDARLMDLCYKVEALDAKGKVTRRYEPICVPKFMERQSQSFNRQRSPDTTGVIKTGKIQPDALKQLASLNFFALAPNPPIDELCLSDPQFTDFRSMTLDEIRAFLKEHDSFLQGQIKDVDGVEIDPAQELFNAAQASQINPQVLLGTLQKEQSAVTRPTPLPVDRLKLIMGFGTPTTIRQQVRDAAAQFRRDFDRLSESPPQPTASGWQVGVPKDTLDPLTVTPASKSVATLYSYTPWAGQAFGGRPDKGGNGLFCQVWEQFGFRPPEPLVLNPQNPTLTCPDGSVTFTASGGRLPYSWSTTKLEITPSGDTKVEIPRAQC